MHKHLKNNEKFSKKILKWYDANDRELPWKQDEDAYSIWLSEIIMQQTRVEYGKIYYKKFKELFPTVHHLAAADFSEIMKAWEGLGYYSRARNLYATAQKIVHDFNGIFPESYDALLTLKGIGPYTAAALGSFAFNIPKAAIDGNAYRLFSRYFGIDAPIDQAAGKKIFQQLGDQFISKKRPGEFNQAVMNLGALVCTPTSPKCMLCPLNDSCYAYHHNQIHSLPVKSKNLKVRKRYFTYWVLKQNNKTFIEERKAKDIWRNLYQFPLTETTRPTHWQNLIEQSVLADFKPKDYSVVKIIENQSQRLTHQYIQVNFIEVKIVKELIIDSYLPVKIKELKKYPFPKVINGILEILVT